MVQDLRFRLWELGAWVEGLVSLRVGVEALAGSVEDGTPLLKRAPR